MDMQSPSSSSFSYDFNYDVFISFRGADTRFGFTGNLYKALSHKGIQTFIDDMELPRGDEITPSLLKSIEDSRIAIIVFSKDYASSSFCLDELVHIIHYFKAKGRLVLPVFYDVKPSHVRDQKYSYGKALFKHKKRFQDNKKNTERLLKWKIALKQAADLSGYHINPRTEYEHKFIKKIVKDVSNKINHVPLHVADYLVGLESRISEVNSLLELGSNDGVCIIGIVGIGGMGKTTLAQAVYNSIANQFQFKCFLHNVRENSVKHGLEYIQEQLLSKSIGFETKFGHVNEGIPIIRRRLCQKKILLILDDVDELEQLRSLIGEPGWLGRGSKVIITTRDKHLLSSHGIKKINEADGLNNEQALELLRTKAFKSNKNDSSYDSILNRAAKYASGLPLALEVVGSSLFGMNIAECESLLGKYERIPHKDILKILKVSFNALDDEQKSVFLDIACFFKGDTLAHIEEELQSHYDHCIKTDLKVLVDKSLIKINTDDYIGPMVTLHDLIEDMGKEIVRQESPNKPGERSRLWFYDDIVKVLKEDMGTGNIEMIYLDCLSKKNVIEWNGNAFKKMTNLKTLVIKNGHFSKDTEYLPNSLRVLRWEGRPSMSPSSFILNKKFNYMKVLSLFNCKYLTYIPDVSSLQNLEKLAFIGCENLITIDNSVGHLYKLEILDASGCIKLETFPPLQLPSLKGLNLSWCESLKNFPELLCNMTNIKDIVLYGSPIEEFPNSFRKLSEIRCLVIPAENTEWFLEDLEDNDKMNSSQNVVLSKMEYLRCGRISNKCLQMLLNWCLNVTTLDLSDSNLKILPECLSECHHLRDLKLDYCASLEEISGFPPKLEKFSARGCYSLSSSSRRMLLNQNIHKKLQESGYKKFCLPTGTEGIPDWFNHKSRGQSISFWFRKKIPSVTFILLFQGSTIPKIYLFVNEDYLYNDLSADFLYNVLDTEHPYLFDLKLKEQIQHYKRSFVSEIKEGVLKGEWIHVELKLIEHFPLTEKNDISEDEKIKILSNAQMGIHVWEGNDSSDNESNMEEDVIFTNPYNDTEKDDDSSDDESKRLEGSETETVDFAQMGYHEESNTKEDVIFTNPNSRKIKLDEYLNYRNTSLSEFEPPLKKQRLVEVGVSETQILQQQHLAALESGRRKLDLTETKEKSDEDRNASLQQEIDYYPKGK